MAEGTSAAQRGSNRQTSLDIPWLRQWENGGRRVKTEEELDRSERLVNIDYMTMLEELEFH